MASASWILRPRWSRNSSKRRMRRRTSAVVKRFASYGVAPLGDGPAEFAATIAADIPVWAEAVRTTGVALQ